MFWEKIIDWNGCKEASKLYLGVDLEESKEVLNVNGPSGVWQSEQMIPVSSASFTVVQTVPGVVEALQDRTTQSVEGYRTQEPGGVTQRGNNELLQE